MRPFSVSLFAVPLVFLTIAHGAVIAQPSNLLLSTTPDASLPSNQTISKPLKCINNSLLPKAIPELTCTPSLLPPSPYFYRIPNDHTATVTFSSYTSRISLLSTIECLIELNEEVQDALIEALRDRDPDRVVPLRYIRKDAQHAVLIIRPIDRQLKWVTCAQALQALRLFLNTWEFVGVNFEVEVEGVKVAEGALAER